MAKVEKAKMARAARAAKMEKEERAKRKVGQAMAIDMAIASQLSHGKRS